MCFPFVFFKNVSLTNFAILANLHFVVAGGLVLEEGEVDGAVGAMLQEVGSGLEAEVLSVFEDEDAFGCKDLCLEDEGGDVCEVLQRVGWIGEDDVELGAFYPFDIFEDVGEDGLPCRVVQIAGCALQELEVLVVFLYADHAAASARDEFESDAACACKEVECGWLGNEIYIDVVQNVEKAFFCKIGSGTCLEGSRHVKPLVFVFSANDSHNRKSIFPLPMLEFSICVAGDHIPLCKEGSKEAFRSHRRGGSEGRRGWWCCRV